MPAAGENYFKTPSLWGDFEFSLGELEKNVYPPSPPHLNIPSPTLPIPPLPHYRQQRLTGRDLGLFTRSNETFASPTKKWLAFFRELASELPAAKILIIELF